MTNQYPGLARGPIDHEASSVINVVANGAIDMGSVVKLDTPPTSELLPRVSQTPGKGIVRYGVAVGGDTDGIYGDGSAGTTGDGTFATAGAGQGVVVVTQGRCLARVLAATGAGPANNVIAIDDPLTNSATEGVLQLAEAGDEVIARALQPIVSGELDIIAIDIQREGVAA